MFKFRLRARASLAVIALASLLVLPHTAHAGTAGTVGIITAPPITAANPAACLTVNGSLFCFGPYGHSGEVNIIVNQDGTYQLVDANGNPLPLNFCDTNAPYTKGATFTSSTIPLIPCAGGTIPQILVIPAGSNVLARLSFISSFNGVATFTVVNPTVMLPGYEYAIVPVNNTFLYCGVAGFPC